MLFPLLLGEHRISYEQISYIAFENHDWWLIGTSHKKEIYQPLRCTAGKYICETTLENAYAIVRNRFEAIVTATNTYDLMQAVQEVAKEHLILKKKTKDRKNVLLMTSFQ